MEKHETVLMRINGKSKRHLLAYQSIGYTLCGLAIDLEPDEGEAEVETFGRDKKVDCRDCLRAIAFYKLFNQ